MCQWMEPIIIRLSGDKSMQLVVKSEKCSSRESEKIVGVACWINEAMSMLFCMQ